MNFRQAVLLSMGIIMTVCVYSQAPPSQIEDTAVISSQSVSSKYFDKVSSKYFDKVSKQTTTLNNRINKKSQKLLRRLQRQEMKLKQQLYPLDSISADNFFADAQHKYRQLSDNISGKAANLEGSVSGEYLPYLDSLKGSLSFLNENKSLLSTIKSVKLDNALNDVKQFQSKLQQADMIKKFIRERKQQLQDMLSRYTSPPAGIKKTLGKYNREIFYYNAQIREYKETFRDPDKLQRTALTLLNKIPAFQQFMKEHSELGGLFSLPGNYGNPQGIAGLQTRNQVQQSITNQMGGGPNAGQLFGQQVQAAQSQLDQFKQKLNSLGAGSGDMDMPDFKPREMRTKTFFQRLEYGTNMQSTKSSFFFPITTDISMMVGYRIDDKKIIGLGLGGKIGWGKDIKHITVSGQGLNFRSFIDVKIKKSFYASGGFEYNFQKPFREAQQLYKPDDWTKSGLIGISKIVSIKSKVFKKTKIQLLWDFLSYAARPRVSEPVKFRVGYSF